MTSGPGGREPSVQFSLQELLKLEDERLAEQSRERQAREAATQREREESERRRRADLEAKARAEAEERERGRRGELEELARREAIEKAIVEQSRLEVEARTRAEERERERRHELEIERLRAAGKKGQLGSVVGGALLGGVVMLVVGLGIHLGVTKPASEHRLAELQRLVTAADARADEANRKLDDQRRTGERLLKQLGDAQNEISALKNAASTAPKKPGAITLPSSKHGTPTPPPDKTICAGPGDPLCPTISR